MAGIIRFRGVLPDRQRHHVASIVCTYCETSFALPVYRDGQPSAPRSALLPSPRSPPYPPRPPHDDLRRYPDVPQTSRVQPPPTFWKMTRPATMPTPNMTSRPKTTATSLSPWQKVAMEQMMADRSRKSEPGINMPYAEFMSRVLRLCGRERDLWNHVLPVTFETRRDSSLASFAMAQERNGGKQGSNLYYERPASQLPLPLYAATRLESR
ncbi:hypothetical protein LZ31DRAFT_553337 [Colletotrichum somersetense]|nr:hypothetical protein LZ31DRAFT_553337 [Colletotrichum somersetense]